MSETFDLSALYEGGATSQLQRQFVGSEQNFAPNTTLTTEWQAKDGSLLSRSTYSVLWEWVQRTQGSQLVTDTAWLALQVTAPNDAVSVYSSGDGSTTFRVPTVGTDGFAKAVGTATLSQDDKNKGFQDQIQNLTGTLLLRQSHQGTTPLSLRLGSTGAFGGASSVPASANLGPEVGTGEAYTTGEELNFDASRSVRTGEETRPKGQYVRTFIYTGRDIPQYTDINTPIVVNPNLLINGDMSVNQRGAGVPAYGVDRWVNVGNDSAQQSTGSLPVGASHWNQVNKTGAGNFTTEQRVESHTAKQLEGKRATFSWEHFEQATTDNLQVELYINSTVDGGSLVLHGSAIVVADRSTGRKSVTFDTFPATIKNGFRVAIRYNTPSSTSGYSTNAKLEVGTIATAFEPDDHSTNLTKCQRYFYARPTTHVATQNASQSSYVSLIFNHPTTMRLAVNPATSSVTPGVSIQVIGNSNIGFTARVTGVTTATNVDKYWAFSVDAEL